MRWLVVPFAVALAAPARADDAEGLACATSSECGELKCIDAVCRDPKLVGTIRVTEPEGAHRKLLFGDERGYGTQILAADVAALATVPIIIAIAFAADKTPSHSNWGPNLLAMIPPSITGSFVHAMHQRLVPAIVSFFGWASVVGTATGLGAIFGITSGTGCMCASPDNTPRGWFVGGAIAIAGASLMTSLDVYMARSPKRSVPRDQPAFRIAPYATPSLAGGTMGVAGSF